MRSNPTVLLGLSGLGLFAGGLAVGVLALPATWIGWAVLVGVQFSCMLVAYTILHDATHRSASRRHVLNELMLASAGAVFLADGFLFRRIHLIHHAHTHQSGDPDRFASAKTLQGRLARSALITVGYYHFAARRLWDSPKWRRHLLCSPLFAAVAVTGFAHCGHLDIFVILWVIPLLLAQAVLGLLIASLPHDYEHSQTRNLNLPRPICWMLGNGHMHLAHHRFPRVPWYQLPRRWREHQLPDAPSTMRTSSSTSACVAICLVPSSRTSDAR